jgi:hypothetical protein
MLSDMLDLPWFMRIWTIQEASLAQHITFIIWKHSMSWNCDLRTMRAIVLRIKAAAISPHFLEQQSSQGELQPKGDLMRNLCLNCSGQVGKIRKASSFDWSPLLNILETQMRQAARREGVTLYRDQLELAYDYRNRRGADPGDKYFPIFNILENDHGERLQLAPDYIILLEELHSRFIDEIWRIGEIVDW